jgi:hypothetical protein
MAKFNAAEAEWRDFQGDAAPTGWQTGADGRENACDRNVIIDDRGNIREIQHTLGLEPTNTGREQTSHEKKQSHETHSTLDEVESNAGRQRVDDWAWTRVEHMVIYGLGSMEAHHCPRYQLAFALLIAQQLPGLRGPVEVYDPVFSDVDCMLLEQLGLKV